MDSRMSPPQMTHYRSVQNRAVEGEPVTTVHVVFNGGDPARTGCWWEPGPVDTCCCCFPLRTGVGILATLDVLAFGEWASYYSWNALKKAAEWLLETNEKIYAENCGEGTRPDSEVECKQLAEAIEQNQEAVDHLSDPTIYVVIYVLVALSMASGALGLLGVFGSHAKAARFYMWTWLPRFFAGVVVALAFGATINDMTLLFRGWRLFWFIYFLKVVWSYQEVLKTRVIRASSLETAQGAAVNVEPTSVPAGDDGSSARLV
ncbi:unnamed protein product [Pylaiella littoralis]